MDEAVIVAVDVIGHSSSVVIDVTMDGDVECDVDDSDHQSSGVIVDVGMLVDSTPHSSGSNSGVGAGLGNSSPGCSKLLNADVSTAQGTHDGGGNGNCMDETVSSPHTDEQPQPPCHSSTTPMDVDDDSSCVVDDSPSGSNVDVSLPQQAFTHLHTNTAGSRSEEDSDSDSESDSDSDSDGDGDDREQDDDGGGGVDNIPPRSEMAAMQDEFGSMAKEDARTKNEMFPAVGVFPGAVLVIGVSVFI